MLIQIGDKDEFINVNYIFEISPIYDNSLEIDKVTKFQETGEKQQADRWWFHVFYNPYNMRHITISVNATDYLDMEEDSLFGIIESKRDSLIEYVQEHFRRINKS